MIAFKQSVGVVVDGFARSSQQAGGRVFFAKNQVSVRLAALQRHPHRHLAQRGASQRVGSAEGLRAKQHVDSKGSALADQAVEQQRRLLMHAIVLDKELLELVDDQQHTRHRLVRTRIAISGHVLNMMLAEQVAAFRQHPVQPLQNTQAKLPVTLDRDDSRMWQFVSDVGLELDSLLEVDQVELDLVRPIVQRDVGDQRVQETRLARPGLARNQHVLTRAAAQVQVLQLRRTRPTQGNVQAATTVPTPVLGPIRRNPLEWHFHPTRVPSMLAHVSHNLHELRRLRWTLQ